MIRLNKIARPLAVMLALGLSASFCHADDNAYFKVGPIELTVPFKTMRVVYLYDFNVKRNLVGAETPFISLWQKIEGTGGVVTSLDAQGAPFLGGNILIGNLLDKWVTLPPDFTIGGFGSYDFRADKPIYGLKASLKIWG